MPKAATLRLVPWWNRDDDDGGGLVDDRVRRNSVANPCTTTNCVELAIAAVAPVLESDIVDTTRPLVQVGAVSNGSNLEQSIGPKCSWSY
jgi:hypothetical protein